MTKTKSTKRALLMSGLALLMCVSMFVGSTFAWFTDSVKTGVNTIQAGTLDIVLEYEVADGVWENAEGKTLNFKKAANAPAGEAILWEPGCTYELPAIRVRNNGNLALKYNMVINGIDGDAKLLEAIEFTANGGAVTNFSGELLAKNDDSGEIVIKGHMKEEAGNEYQGLKIEGIGITVVATQYTYEKDSYSELYDELATYMNKNANGEWEIESVGQLVYLSKSVNEGKDYAGETIVLTKDIDLAGINWAPIGNFTYDINTNGDGYVYGETFKGTFDGQGHTIKNLYVNAPNTSGVGLFGYVTGATVKNLTIENVKLEALSHAAAFVARARGTSTVTNCNLTGDIDINAYWAYVAGIVGKAYAINLDNCNVTPDGTGTITSENRNAVGSILAWMEAASTVSNCKAQDLNLTGWANIGGITGFVISKGTVANCSAKNLTLTKTRIGGLGTIGLAAGGWDGNNITIKDNTFDTITLNGNMVPHESVNILFGGEFTGTVHNQNGVAASNNAQTNITDNRIEVTLVSNANGLKNALAAGENVVLSDDVHFENTKLSIDSGKEITIDLNGNMLSGVNTASGTTALIENKGTLNIIGNGTITVLAENPDTDWDPEGFPTYASNTIANRGNLTIGEGVRIENQTAGGGASYAIDNYAGATLTVNGGEIIQSGGDVAIRMNTASATAENKVTINGGTISGKRAIWIHLAGSSAATAPKTTLEINGGNLSGTQMCIYSYSYGNSFSNTNVTINGGTFNGDVQFGGGYKGDQETVSVTGGTFNGEIGRWVTSSDFQPIA